MSRESSDNFSNFSDMEEQLEKAIAEHKKLDDYVDKINRQKILTKEDARKLSRLRKEKLSEKDKVAFLRHKLKKMRG